MSDAITNCFVYLIGIAGTGKLTVARAIAAKTGARLVDNQSLNAPIFSVIATDGRTKLPRAVWDRALQVRAAVLETIATLSPPAWSFVFTHAASGDAYDIAAYHLAVDAAARRGARFLAVRLLCAPDEIARRVASPERAALLKATNPEASRRLAAAGAVYDPRDGRTMTLDITSVAPDAAAETIIAALRALPPVREAAP